MAEIVPYQGTIIELNYDENARISSEGRVGFSSMFDCNGHSSGGFASAPQTTPSSQLYVVQHTYQRTEKSTRLNPQFVK